MGETTLVAELTTLIQQQQQLASQLEKLLQQEQQYLLEDNPDAMRPLIEQKEQLAKQMAALQNQILTRTKADYPISRDDELGQYIQQADASGQLFQQWESLLKIAENCRRINEINGATLNLKKRYTENGLAILRGQIGGSRASVYSKKGVQSSSQTSRILSKA